MRFRASDRTSQAHCKDYRWFKNGLIETKIILIILIYLNKIMERSVLNFEIKREATCSSLLVA